MFVKSVILVSRIKILWNFFSKSAHPLIELGSNDENQVKAGPDSDKEKNQTLCASSTKASPS